MRNLALIFSIFLVACEKNESAQVAPQPTKMTYEQALKSDDFKKIAGNIGSKFTEEDRAKMGAANAKMKEEMANAGLTVGAMAPDFTLTNAFGGQVSLKETLEQGPVVLVFYRGA